ncbi:MAG: 3-hydroxyacyl-CoA dehydrogenase NAD-binding domain-containing protein, partial [Alphaproteobacteria bacterium]
MAKQPKATGEMTKIAVIGAGVMGAGIAAQCANAGVDVLLLDIIPKDAADRNVIAKGALEKLKKSNPAAFMHARCAGRVQVGNTTDDLAKLAECDWIIEAVIERLDIKQDLYRKIDKHRRKDAIVSSNTSTIPLTELVAGMSENFREHFLITHFFNPPRYLRLLELVQGRHTLNDVV